MATSAPQLTLNENNDEIIRVAIQTNQPAAGTPLDLTGMSLEAFVKASAQAGDGDAATWKGTSTGGGGITITDPVGGLVAIQVPASALDTSKKWWRLDVLSGGLRKTAIYGPLTVVDL